MQSKPGSNYVLYLEFDGGIITPINQESLVPSATSLATNWVQLANIIDTDGTFISSKRFIPYIGGLLTDPERVINQINVPPPDLQTRNKRTEMTKIVAKKYEIFDVNVTDEKNIFDNAGKKNRQRCFITNRPDAIEYNNLLNDFSENSAFPYSWRRFLMGYTFLFPWNFQNQLQWFLGIPLTTININWNIFDGFSPDPSVLGVNEILPGADRAMNLPCFSCDNRNQPMILQTANYNQTPNMRGGFTRTVINYDKVGTIAAHELGHLLYLAHRGIYQYEYYPGHDEWGPLMGFPLTSPAPELAQLRKLIQWSKAEYGGATNKFQDDILKIQQQIPLIKKIKKQKQIADKDDFIKFEKVHSSDFPKWDQELGYNLRTLTKSDVVTDDNKKVIQGMIGFPYDFDVLKILLPEGTYNFSIDPLSKTSIGENSMFDPDILLLNCNCQRSKQEVNPSCSQNDLPSFYPENIEQNKMQCVAFNPDIGDEYTPIQQFSPDNGFSMKMASITLNHKSIVYLMIRGDKNLTPNDGWSRYGSVGKYNLQITRNSKDGFSDDPSTFLSNNILPKSRCEEYNVCNDNIILYVEDESGISGDEDEEHFLELDVRNSGGIEKKKFLVYGQPIDLDTNTDTKEYEGRFFLTVPIDGKCKKQEFIIGNNWERKKQE